MVWWVWFGRQGPAWLPRAVAGLALLQMISTVLGEELFFALVPHPVTGDFQMVSVVVRLLFFALLVWIVIQGIRSRGLEGWQFQRNISPLPDDPMRNSLPAACVF